MRLTTRLIGHWPKLAWCARVNGCEIEVLHGPRVETGGDWVFEGAWSGRFGSGDFDESTAAVIGTGLRVRGDSVSFATSTNALDRICHVTKDGASIVSNSLACLLAVSGERLAPDHAHSESVTRYVRDFRETPQSIPTRDGSAIHLHRYHRLIVADGRLVAQPRVDPAPDFETFEEYRGFLDETIIAIRDNLRDPQRKYKVTPAATISNGYDSSAAAVVAEPLELQYALTISRGGVFSHLHDSGERVAETLGIPVRTALSVDSRYKDHLLVWAGTGRSLDLNMTLFDFPDDLTLLTIGNHGDTMWEKGLSKAHQASHHFLDRDPSGAGLVEWRLHHGAFFAAVPYFGASKWDCLSKIHSSKAMDPWRVGGSYDRPIPRRIVEERGVAREAFGTKKSLTSSRPIYHPTDPVHGEALEDFLAKHGKKLPPRLGLLQRPVDIVRSLAIARMGLEPRDDFRDLYFTWANTYLAENVYGS